jgi:hypothetical protein
MNAGLGILIVSPPFLTLLNPGKHSAALLNILKKRPLDNLLSLQGDSPGAVC